MTLQTISKKNSTVLTIFHSFTKLHFGLSERNGLILDLCDVDAAAVLAHATVARSGQLDSALDERSLIEVIEVSSNFPNW